MSKIRDTEFDHLNFLLKASSKKQVVELCRYAFENRDKINSPTKVNTKIATDILSIEESDALNLLQALCSLIKTSIFHGYSTSSECASMFPEKFHKNLGELLSEILAENYSLWKSKATSSSVSLPKLVEFDWRVDLKMGSNKVSRMNEPTCILHMKISNSNLPDDHKDRLSTLNVELSKEKLDTMLNGLGRIRDQLSAVAKN